MELLENSNKKRILLELVKELVRNAGGHPAIPYASGKHEALPLKKEIPQRKIISEKKIIELPRSKISQAKPKSGGGIENVPGELKEGRYEVSLKSFPQPREINRPALQQARLTIPEQKLPIHLQYLQPTPTNKDIDLGKLTPLIRDPMVKIIDCPGPEQNLVVTGNMGIKKTGIILGRDEINDIVEKFSKESKIPVHEGVFKVVVGRFIFLAIVSEIIGSRFTLRKMIAPPTFPGQQRR